VFIAQR